MYWDSFTFIHILWLSTSDLFKNEADEDDEDDEDEDEDEWRCEWYPSLFNQECEICTVTNYSSKHGENLVVECVQLLLWQSKGLTVWDNILQELV